MARTTEPHIEVNFVTTDKTPYAEKARIERALQSMESLLNVLLDKAKKNAQTVDEFDRLMCVVYAKLQAAEPTIPVPKDNADAPSSGA